MAATLPAPLRQMQREVKRMENEVDAAHRVVDKLENTAQTARKILEQNLAAYATLHYEGAVVAASKGDTRPAEWALVHAKSQGQAAVDPPKTQPDTGTKVFIGIKVGAMPLGQGTAEIISVEDGAEVPLEVTN